MLKQIFDGWQTWIWCFAAIFFQHSQPVISFACIFLFGLLLSKDYYKKIYSKDINFLTSSYSQTLNEISATNPQVIQGLKKSVAYTDFDKSYPEESRKLTKEQIANGKLLKKVIAEYDLFDK